MRLILFFFLLTCFHGYAQTSLFNGSFTINEISGSAPNYTINGFFQAEGTYSGVDILPGDRVYFIYGNDCDYIEVDTIYYAYANLVSLGFSDPDTTFTSIPTGNGLMTRLTPNYSYSTPFTADVSDFLRKCVGGKLVSELDQIEGTTSLYADSIFLDTAGLTNISDTVLQGAIEQIDTALNNIQTQVDALPTGDGVTNQWTYWSGTNTLSTTNQLTRTATGLKILDGNYLELGKWTTVGRPTLSQAQLGYNTTLNGIEWHNGTRTAVAAESTAPTFTAYNIVVPNANGQFAILSGAGSYIKNPAYALQFTPANNANQATLPLTEGQLIYNSSNSRYEFVTSLGAWSPLSPWTALSSNSMVNAIPGVNIGNWSSYNTPTGLYVANSSRVRFGSGSGSSGNDYIYSNWAMGIGTNETRFMFNISNQRIISTYANSHKQLNGWVESSLFPFSNFGLNDNIATNATTSTGLMAFAGNGLIRSLSHNVLPSFNKGASTSGRTGIFGYGYAFGQSQTANGVIGFAEPQFTITSMGTEIWSIGVSGYGRVKNLAPAGGSGIYKSVGVYGNATIDNTVLPGGGVELYAGYFEVEKDTSDVSKTYGMYVKNGTTYIGSTEIVLDSIPEKVSSDRILVQDSADNSVGYKSASSFASRYDLYEINSLADTSSLTPLVGDKIQVTSFCDAIYVRDSTKWAILERGGTPPDFFVTNVRDTLSTITLNSEYIDNSFVGIDSIIISSLKINNNELLDSSYVFVVGELDVNLGTLAASMDSDIASSLTALGYSAYSTDVYVANDSDIYVYVWVNIQNQMGKSDSTSISYKLDEGSVTTFTWYADQPNGSRFVYDNSDFLIKASIQLSHPVDTLYFDGSIGSVINIAVTKDSIYVEGNYGTNYRADLIVENCNNKYIYRATKLLPGNYAISNVTDTLYKTNGTAIVSGDVIATIFDLESADVEVLAGNNQLDIENNLRTEFSTEYQHTILGTNQDRLGWSISSNERYTIAGANNYAPLSNNALQGRMYLFDNTNDTLVVLQAKQIPGVGNFYRSSAEVRIDQNTDYFIDASPSTDFAGTDAGSVNFGVIRADTIHYFARIDGGAASYGLGNDAAIEYPYAAASSATNSLLLLKLDGSGGTITSKDTVADTRSSQGSLWIRDSIVYYPHKDSVWILAVPILNDTFNTVAADTFFIPSALTPNNFGYSIHVSQDYLITTNQGASGSVVLYDRLTRDVLAYYTESASVGSEYGRRIRIDNKGNIFVSSTNYNTGGGVFHYRYNPYDRVIEKKGVFGQRIYQNTGYGLSIVDNGKTTRLIHSAIGSLYNPGELVINKINSKTNFDNDIILERYPNTSAFRTDEFGNLRPQTYKQLADSLLLGHMAVYGNSANDTLPYKSGDFEYIDTWQETINQMPISLFEATTDSTFTLKKVGIWEFKLDGSVYDAIQSSALTYQNVIDADSGTIVGTVGSQTGTTGVFSFTPQTHSRNFTIQVTSAPAVVGIRMGTNAVSGNMVLQEHTLTIKYNPN